LSLLPLRLPCRGYPGSASMGMGRRSCTAQGGKTLREIGRKQCRAQDRTEARPARPRYVPTRSIINIPAQQVYAAEPGRFARHSRATCSLLRAAPATSCVAGSQSRPSTCTLPRCACWTDPDSSIWIPSSTRHPVRAPAGRGQHMIRPCQTRACRSRSAW
jgi:hypothetical protein